MRNPLREPDRCAVVHAGCSSQSFGCLPDQIPGSGRQPRRIAFQDQRAGRCPPDFYCVEEIYGEDQGFDGVETVRPFAVDLQEQVHFGRCPGDAGVRAGTFHTDDVHLLANTLYAAGLGGLQLARVGMLVKEAAPGVPTVATLSPEQVKEHLVASSVAMAVGAAPR